MVYVDGRHGNYAAGTDLDELQQECFAPLKTSDDRFFLYWQESLAKKRQE